MRAVLILALSATMAHGQSSRMLPVSCMPDYSKIEETAPSVRGRGIVGPQAVIELRVSPDGGWWVLGVHPDGSACLIASGSNWTEIEPAALGIDG